MRRFGWLGIAATILFFGGMYILLLVFSPQINIPVIGLGQVDVQALLRDTKPDKNQLHIPQINVTMPIATGGESVLLQGIWHRHPQNGDPERGGNFVLSGHRFYMGFTPAQTRVQSPLYNIDKLKIGDDFFVDFNGKRYTYRVSRLYDVPPTAVEIEGPSITPKLTLYSCDLRGAAVGRYVVEAMPVYN